jgi:hypothetical protein
MKKTALLLFACLFFTSIRSHSQQLQIEVIAGPSLVRLWGNDFDKEYTKAKVSFFAGAGLNFIFNEKSSLTTRLLFERKGSVFKNDLELMDNNDPIVGSGKHKIVTHFDYLTLPLLYGRTFGKGKVKFKLEAGPYAGFLLAQRSITSWDGTTTETKDNTKNYKRLDAGVSAGINIVIPLYESFRLRIGNQYNLGLLDVADFSAGNEAVRTLSIQFVTGLIYQVKR